MGEGDTATEGSHLSEVGGGTSVEQWPCWDDLHSTLIRMGSLGGGGAVLCLKDGRWPAEVRIRTEKDDPLESALERPKREATCRKWSAKSLTALIAMEKVSVCGRTPMFPQCCLEVMLFQNLNNQNSRT